jgi:hypothetical protein
MSARDGTMTEQRVRERPTALRQTFATFERGRGLVELLCRVCGTVIGKTLPVGQQRVRRVKGQTFIETEVQFCYLANYREIEIEQTVDFEDPARLGKHVGCVCVDCAPKLQADPALLAQFCETDLAQWRSEGQTITEQMDRRPTRVLRVAQQIRD